MSLYNMMQGVNPATFFVLPMLGKHGEAYPRFRDCFIIKHNFQYKDRLLLMLPVDENEKPSKIYVLTRTGGGNRESYRDEINELRKMPEYITDYNTSKDTKFATH